MNDQNEYFIDGGVNPKLPEKGEYDLWRPTIDLWFEGKVSDEELKRREPKFAKAMGIK